MVRRVYCKKIIQSFYFLCIGCLMDGTSAQAFDTQAMYRTPLFLGGSKQAERDWATRLQVRFSDGNTHKSLDGQGRTRSLLSGATGLLDITRLGLGVAQAGMVQTATYWDDVHNQFYAGALPVNGDGLVDIGGRFRTHEIAIDLCQHTKYGFFLQIFAPIAQARIDKIVYTHKGNNVVNGVNMPTFIQNTLPLVLAEHGYKEPTASLDTTSFRDIVTALGWQGYAKIGSKYIGDIGGALRIGGIIPAAGSVSIGHPSSIALGYQGHYGVLAHGNAELGVLGWVSLGLWGGTSIFFKKSSTMRLKTHEDQSGWLKLGKGFVRRDQGSLWDFGVYARMSLFMPGLSAFCGYAFARQEATHLEIEDKNVAVMLTKSEVDATVVPHVVRTSVVKSSQAGDVNTIINTDRHLSGWEHHTALIGITYHMSDAKHSLKPLLQLEYAYPFDGKNIFKTPCWAGTAGLSLHLGF